MLNPAAADNDRDDHGRTLQLRANFTSFHSTQADPSVYAVGDQFTYGGTLARSNHPDRLIGTFGAQFVITAPAGAAWLGNGV